MGWEETSIVDWMRDYDLYVLSLLHYSNGHVSTYVFNVLLDVTTKT